MYRRIDGLLEKQSSSRILLGLARLISQDRRRKANFLAYLNEVDERRLYASEGYSSLFRFLTERHGISESSALKRIQAAKLCRKFPFLYRDVAEGGFSLSALSRLSPFVNGSNSHLLFPECRGKSVREVENALVKRFPKADVEEKLQKSISPLGDNRIKVQFMTDEAFQKDFEEVRALLSHRFPEGKLKDVMGLALKTLLKELKKEPRVARAAASVLTTSEASVRSRYIPRGIQSELRANSSCEFKREDGSLCGETHFLEIDHIQPYALGGSNNRENLRLLCWAHNQLRAEHTFKRRWRRPSRD